MTDPIPHIRISYSGDYLPKGKNALTIGNFDGCHLGHQKLIERTLETADRLQLTAAALTFFPRPEIYFHPERAAEGSLFSESMKSRAFHEQSIKIHFAHDFSGIVSQMSPNQFLTSVLIERLNAQAIIVGENFRFGQGRTGDTEFLVKNGGTHTLTTLVEKSATLTDEIVSSTRIRCALRAGKVDEANRLLGRPYLLEGILRKGDQLGRTIGFPTLNLDVREQLIPGQGVYCGYVWVKTVSSGPYPPIMRLQHDALPAAFNIGFRPTLNGTVKRIEAHVLTPFGKTDCYDLEAGFYISNHIRDELKFSGLDELREQITKDVAQAKSILKLN